MAQEKNFENKVKRFLQSVGVYPFGTPRGKMSVESVGYYEKRFANRMTKSGLPDMHVVINGMSVEVELKADHGRPSEMQLFMVEQVRRSGGIAIILYPDQFEKFKSMILDLVDTRDAYSFWGNDGQLQFYGG